MAHLGLLLMGTFEVTLAGKPVAAFKYDKVRALLAYLAVESDRSHRRETLAGLLWPDRPERRARQSLSQALFNLRRSIGDAEARPPFLNITPQTLQFNPSSDYRLDVADFIGLLTACRAHAHDGQKTCKACIDRLQRAVALYRGNFLTGFSLSDSSAFEEWAILTRERLHRLVVEALGHLAGYFECRGAYEQALNYAWRQVEFEPWQEEVQRQLMRLLALTGQRGAAVAQFETYRRLLAEELGVDPEAETSALYEHIRTGKLHRAETPQESIFGAPETSSATPLFLRTPPPPSPRSAAPFVAREQELEQLNALLKLALAGQGQMVFVTGGPGRGKTALLREFARRAQAADRDLIVAGGQGNAHTGAGDPYLPFRQILGHLTADVEAMWAAGMVTSEYADRLRQLFSLSVQVLLEVGPDLIGTFVSAEALLERAAASGSQIKRVDWLPRLKQFVERDTASPVPTLQLQSSLFEQYIQLLRALADHKPLILLLDDLQWADKGSINLLFHLGRRLEGSRILMIGAYRPAEIAIGYPEERHPLEPVINEFRRLRGQIEIDLSQAEGRRFVDAYLDIEPNQLGDAFRQTLFRQTGGHPMFVVELLREMQERGDLRRDARGCWIEGPSFDWERLPARVEAVIAERLGRLPQSLREVLTIASVEGETFTAEVVAQVRTSRSLAIVRSLSKMLERTHRLVEARGVRRRNDRHFSRYRFRHILYQKYLYHQLDPAERTYLHEAVGLALERLCGPAAGEVAVQLARHFQKASLTDKAIAYFVQAGEKAARLSANEEAIAHLTRGLDLLQTLPDSPERARQKIELQLALAGPNLAT